MGDAMSTDLHGVALRGMTVAREYAAYLRRVRSEIWVLVRVRLAPTLTMMAGNGTWTMRSGWETR